MRQARPLCVARTDAGFGLIEVVVACVVLGIMAAAVLGVILRAQAQGVSNRSRIAAANLAAREIDIIRDEFHRTDTAPMEIADAGTVVNPHQLDGAVDGDPLMVDGTPYTVTRSVQWNITGDGQSACSGGSLVVYPTLGVTVAVTWPQMGSVQPVVSSAALAPDKGDGIPATDSFVAVRVNDQEGQPSVGRSVVVSGGGATKYGTTDSSGCAVVEVSPATGTGTTYTAQVADDGYVDISNTEHPSKNVGQLTQGQLNNNVTFQVAFGGYITLHLVDEAGHDLTGSIGSQTVTLEASEYAGASPFTQLTLTGATTSVGPLWPTTYGAFYGAPPEPASGPAESGVLEANGTLQLHVPIAYAQTSVTGMPAGTTDVYAVPDVATGTCSDSRAIHLSDPDAVSLLPGAYRFYARGDKFSCAPGPGTALSGTTTPVSLVPGDNAAVEWSPSTLTVTGAPSGTLYALDANSSGTSSCPDPALDASGYTLSSGADTLPAGNWYLYVRNGSNCAPGPASISPLTLEHGASLTKTWPPHEATVSITGIERLNSSRPSVFLSSVPSSELTCSSGYTITCSGPSGATVQGPLSTSGSSGAWTATASAADGTWYVVGAVASYYTVTRAPAGTVTVGPYSTSLSIDFNTSSPQSVGP